MTPEPFDASIEQYEVLSTHSSDNELSEDPIGRPCSSLNSANSSGGDSDSESDEASGGSALDQSGISVISLSENGDSSYSQWSFPNQRFGDDSLMSEMTDEIGDNTEEEADVAEGEEEKGQGDHRSEEEVVSDNRSAGGNATEFSAEIPKLTQSAIDPNNVLNCLKLGPTETRQIGDVHRTILVPEPSYEADAQYLVMSGHYTADLQPFIANFHEIAPQLSLIWVELPSEENAKAEAQWLTQEHELPPRDDFARQAVRIDFYCSEVGPERNCDLPGFQTLGIVPIVPKGMSTVNTAFSSTRILANASSPLELDEYHRQQPIQSPDSVLYLRKTHFNAIAARPQNLPLDEPRHRMQIVQSRSASALDAYSAPNWRYISAFILLYSIALFSVAFQFGSKYFGTPGDLTASNPLTRTWSYPATTSIDSLNVELDLRGCSCPAEVNVYQRKGQEVRIIPHYANAPSDIEGSHFCYISANGIPHIPHGTQEVEVEQDNKLTTSEEKSEETPSTVLALSWQALEDFFREVAIYMHKLKSGSLCRVKDIQKSSKAWLKKQTDQYGVRNMQHKWKEWESRYGTLKQDRHRDMVHFREEMATLRKRFEEAYGRARREGPLRSGTE